MISQTQSDNDKTQTTIVTAFIYNINNNNRSIDDYIEYGKKLLRVNVNKVVFIENEIYNKYFLETKEEEYPTTTFVMTKKEDIYLYNYIVIIHIVI